MRLWTQDEVDFLIELRKQGHSARKIAVLMKSKFTVKRFTRNSVIGKLHRLGLCLHVSPEDHSARISEGMRNAKKAQPKFKSYPLPKPDPTPETAISFDDLADHHCRYPYGEKLQTKFCGKEKVLGQSYCVEHLVRCFRTIGA